MSLLSLRDVTVLFRRNGASCPALQGVSLDIQSQEVLTIMGASGSGKTTLLNVCAGIERPTSGKVLLDGDDLSAASEAAVTSTRRGKIGFVFQSLNLLRHLPARMNVELPLVLAGWAPADRRRRVDELLGACGLSDRADALPDQLSAGQQQRLAVLRALAHRPSLVLMDEPTSCLDSQTAQAVMDLVLQMAASQQTAVVLATHDPAVAQRTGRTILLKDGAIASDSNAGR